MDFSRFWLFFTLFDLALACFGQSSSPVWQKKGIVSGVWGIWWKNGIMPSKYWLYAFKVGQFQFIPAMFGGHYRKIPIFFFQFSEIFQGKICQILTYFLLANTQMGFRGSKLSFCSKKPFFCPKSGCIGFRDPSIMRSAQIHMKRLPYFFFINFWWFCVFTDWRNLYRGPRYDLLKLR